MTDQRIAGALREASDTRAVVIEAGAIAATERVLAGCFGDGAPAVVVADETTFALAGAASDAALRGAGREVLDPHVLPGQPALYADYDNVTAVARQLRTHPAIPRSTRSFVSSSSSRPRSSRTMPFRSPWAPARSMIS